LEKVPDKIVMILVSIYKTIYIKDHIRTCIFNNMFYTTEKEWLQDVKW